MQFNICADGWKGTDEKKKYVKGESFNKIKKFYTNNRLELYETAASNIEEIMMNASDDLFY